MEFDLDAFTADVDAALGYESPYSRNGNKRGESGDGHWDEVGSDFMGRNGILMREDGFHFGIEDMHGKGTGDQNRFKRRRIESAEDVPEEEEDERDDEDESDTDEEDDIALLLHPDINMSTALSTSTTHHQHPRPIFKPSALTSTEPLSTVPNFYAYIVQATLLPIRKVQTELLTLYFQHVHPMFPIVDEYKITEAHRKYRGREECMDVGEFAVYQGVLCAGFAHLSEAQVRLTPYRSVLEGQEAQVDQLKARYWSQLTTDQVVLTQICLILSLWSPGWIGTQNNSYWLDMAFKHATCERLWEVKLNDLNKKDDPNNRNRLLWWCCLIRDRVLALGMRRPHRLHKAPSLTHDHLITSSDFGLEAQYPSYLDVESKQLAMLSFIWFCKLSKIMARIAVVKGRMRFERDWDGDSGVDEDEGRVEEGLMEMDVFERELRGWLEGFEGVVEERLGLSRCRVGVGEVVGSAEGGVPVAVSTLRIMVHSLRAGLYQPYLHLPPTHPALLKASIDPLQRMKDGAREVAVTCRDVMGSKKCDAIPTWLVSWVTLPVAVYHVNQLIRQNSTPDQVLMPFLAQLVRRTSGALMLLRTVRAATRDYMEKIAEGEDEVESGKHGIGGRKVPGEMRLRFVYEGFERNEESRTAEAKLLACVTRVVDEALELNGSSQETA
ncbi:hypothetical protein DL98DRAFT_658625 [Cadophora sp. DSE1049]|nr:hypothetical protein DL98DRAFT_658625 [Cadophora sp. DSE1049]